MGQHGLHLRQTEWRPATKEQLQTTSSDNRCPSDNTCAARCVHTQYSSVNRRPLLPEGEWGWGLLVSVSQQTLPRGREGSDNIVNCYSLTSVLVEVVSIRQLAPMFLFRCSPTASVVRYPAIFFSLPRSQPCCIVIVDNLLVVAGKYAASL